MNRSVRIIVTALAAACSATHAQVVQPERQMTGPGWSDLPPVLWQQMYGDVRIDSGQPAGPHGMANREANSVGLRIDDPTRSALFENTVPPGGFANTDVGPMGNRPVEQNRGGDGQRGMIQALDCNGGTGFFSNICNTNPYLTFEDFVATSDPVSLVEFYGAMWNVDSFSSHGNFSGVGSFDVEIWEITGGGACGWAYNPGTRQYFGSFTVAQVNPQAVCNNGLDHYRMRANLGGVSLVPGRNYMITIYARLTNPDDRNIFYWSSTADGHFNVAESWHRSNNTYDRCGPDQAMIINPGDDTLCQPNDCNTTCWFSNYLSNRNVYIAADDFVAVDDEPAQLVKFTGGGYSLDTGTGCGLGGIDRFLIEFYTARVDGGSACGWNVDSFIGSFQVEREDLARQGDCVDIFGIEHNQYTARVPAGFNLQAGRRYVLGVYAIPTDPNDPCLFCWGAGNQVIGFPSYSYNTSTNLQEVCHDIDQAFCVSSCYADMNADGNLNVFDFLQFQTYFGNGRQAADCNGDGNLNIFDFLCFQTAFGNGC